MAQDKLNDFPVVAIGGSAGSLDVILFLLPQLKKDLQVAIIIVLHRKMNAESPLVSLLESKTSLTVSEAEEKQTIVPGHIYLAPADYHMLIEKDQTISLDYSEKINFSRPSIDVCFETAADALGSRLTGVLLSGANADGVEGLKRIIQNKGTAIVQDPLTAEVSFMPAQAIRQGISDNVFTPLEIVAFINSL